MTFDFTKSETDRAAHYSRHRFTTESCGVESAAFCRGELREDEFSACWYATGEFAKKPPYVPNKFKEQIPLLATGGLRRGRVLDVGCGRGMLSSALICLGFTVCAIDFSQAAVDLTKETISENCDSAHYHLVHAGMRHIPEFEWEVYPETVIFSESIEHIPENEFNTVFPLICSWHPLLIVVNAKTLHPIEPDGTGWNHIRRIDDDVYDEIAAHGETRVRAGSHLVVQL